MKFNLYIPTQQEKEVWEHYAAGEGRSLSQFIRQAVREKIQKIKKEIK